MDWIDLKDTNSALIEACVKCASNTAVMHGWELGTTPEKHKESRLHFEEKMRPSKKDKLIYQQIKYLPSYDERGQVALFFQRSKWLTDNAKLGTVWVLSVAFDDDVLPLKGNDSDYGDFLDALNEGPIKDFLKAEKVSSLFSIGPIGSETTKDSRIGQLEIIARTHAFKKGKWDFTNTIDYSYDVKVPSKIRQHWGKHSGGEFRLQEMKYTA